MPSRPITDHTASLALHIFNQLSLYPRPSRKEEQVRDFVLRWAKARAYHTAVDDAGNCVITVPGDDEKSASPPLALQAHFDMVCEAVPGHMHDFSKDPIIPQYRGDWVSARNTTLGADNGIGVALAMAICDDPLVVHPKLELVFTIDEESGLTGAAHLKRGAIKARHLLNLDSEDDKVLINGCAGGANVNIRVPYQLQGQDKLSFSNPLSYSLQIGGFSGGHSGVDIHKPLGNAIQCAAHVLGRVMAAMDTSCYLGATNGGTVHNAIPRDCATEIIFPNKSECKRAQEIAAEVLAEYLRERNIDRKNSDAYCKIVASKARFAVRPRSYSMGLLEMLTALPHGVSSFTANPDIPKTSSNIAKIESKEHSDCILISIRSSERAELEKLTKEIAAIGKKYTRDVDTGDAYPAWHPNPKSRLLNHCKIAYEKTHGSPPRVETIHAGLETAVIANIDSELDLLSYGPLIVNPHSPQERLSISSTANAYRMLVQLLRDW